VRLQRARYGVTPVFKRVDTCAAEFESFTPYLYSTYEDEDESDAQARPKVMILGSGPNRIGQGIEFDYCCCHAAFALREDGFETIMVNCNPKLFRRTTTLPTASISNLSRWKMFWRLSNARNTGRYRAVRRSNALNLALELKRNGVPIIGTAPESIDLAEDRRRFGRLLDD